jgi:hypothetical protein
VAAASLFAVSIGLILLPASVAKLSTLSSFAEVVQRYPFIPPALRSPVSKGFPAVEGILAILLLTGHRNPAIGLAGSGLFLLFAAASGYTLRRWTAEASGPSCGCLGKAGSLKITRGSVLLNLATGLVGVVVTAIGWSSTGPMIPGFIGLGLAILIAGTYWLIAYALSVLDTVARATAQGGVV